MRWPCRRDNDAASGRIFQSAPHGPERMELPMRDLLDDAAARAMRYIESLPTRRVAPDDASVERLAELDIPLPERPSDPGDTIATLDSHSGATMAMGSPRFFGFVIGGALPVTVAANWLATAWDQNAGLMLASPTTPASKKSPCAGWLICSVSPPGPARALSPARRRPTSPLCSPRATTLSSARAGMWKRTGCSARRP